MHPDLLNNPIFLRYYNRWQADPTSAAFVGVADFLRQYRLYDDALRVCEEGLRHNPDLVSGRMVLAQVHAGLGQVDEAVGELQWILRRRPEHPGAKRLLGTLGHEMPATEASGATSLLPSWATVTMARLYAEQGHREQAATIYRLILAREPGHPEAMEGLHSLGKA